MKLLRYNVRYCIHNFFEYISENIYAIVAIIFCRINSHYSTINLAIHVYNGSIMRQDFRISSIPIIILYLVYHLDFQAENQCQTYYNFPHNSV